jgi:hypothetical protein
MSILQQRIADVSNTTAQLVAQLRELEQLREQVKRAQLLADRRQNRRRPLRNRAASRIPLDRPGCEPAHAETDVENREPQPTVLG